MIHICFYVWIAYGRSGIRCRPVRPGGLPPGRTKGRMSGKVAALFCAGVPDGQRTEDREDGGADPEPRDDRKVV